MKVSVWINSEQKKTMESLRIIGFLLVKCVLVQCANNVPYKHLTVDNGEGTIVQDIITLKADEESIVAVVEKLSLEIHKIQRERKKDRAKIEELESKLESYHDETIVSIAEDLQARQRILENYDKISALEEITQDNRLAVESLQYTQKDNSREVRRYREYKEKAAKRFHQIENKIERLEKQKDKNDVTFQIMKDQFITHTKEQLYLRNITKETQKSITKLISNFTTVSSQLNDINSNISYCCSDRNLERNEKQKERDGNSNIILNKNSGTSSHIDIVEFGSGDIIDEYLSKTEESSNKVGDWWTSKSKNTKHGTENQNTTLEYESSGEVGSGEIDELPPFIQGKQYVEKQIFLYEIAERDKKIITLNEQYSHLSDQIKKIETRLTSIQLGNFMQNLQESLINFTQNVITLDQWKISSNQIVNSTLQNQDQIIELTNRIVGNADKITDIKWRLSNNELLIDQQYNILRMYVIRLNNTVEDIKEELKQFHTKIVPLHQERHRANKNNHGMESLVSRLEDLALQIVYNQNRLSTLEVKVLNETLYDCRKYNMDTFQDSQLATHEAIIKSNGNSILLVHELVKKIDDGLHTLDGDVNTNSRRIRGLMNNFESFRGIVPVVVNMQKEINNFRFQLPKDCQDYYNQGFRSSEVYVIHPVGSKRSLKVKCHMTSEGGWTVLQQRFNGSTDFKQNWTEYKNGFGEAEGEYWIGNEAIHLLTANQNYSLLIEMTDDANYTWTANYEYFAVAGLGDRYALKVDGYHGNATDGMGYSNHMAFSAPDLDNDASSTHCAYFYEVGWWYKHCQTCNLNGRYNIGFVWFNLDFNNYLQLTHSVMKIKPN